MENKNLLSSYISGFLSSLFLTLVAFVLVFIHVNSNDAIIPNEILIPEILILAFIQLIVQSFFFLHLAQEKRPNWNLTFFILTFGAILIVVVGSIWIMGHLNHNMMPQQMEHYVQSQDGF